jgi:putative FmdB family regulatory protein
MPTYTYKCPDCGKFDTYQKFSDPTLEDCPTCGSKVKKVFSVPGVIGMENVPTQTYRSDRSALWNSAQAE